MPERAYISRSTHLMGATITISLLPPSNNSQEERTAEQLLDDVFELLNIYNQRFSANDANYFPIYSHSLDFELKFLSYF